MVNVVDDGMIWPPWSTRSCPASMCAALALACGISVALGRKLMFGVLPGAGGAAGATIGAAWPVAAATGVAAAVAAAATPASTTAETSAMNKRIKKGISSPVAGNFERPSPPLPIRSSVAPGIPLGSGATSTPTGPVLPSTTFAGRAQRRFHDTNPDTSPRPHDVSGHRLHTNHVRQRSTRYRVAGAELDGVNRFDRFDRAGNPGAAHGVARRRGPGTNRARGGRRSGGDQPAQHLLAVHRPEPA